MRLKNKIALITGATGGIGAVMARRFAANGASVVLAARNCERGACLVDTIRAEGGEAIFEATDISVEEDVRAAIAKAIERYGRIDVLVNNAGPVDLLLSGADKPVHLLGTEQFEAILRVALHGAFWCSKYTIPHMMERGSGSIINISSISASAGLPGLPAYSAGKGALSALTRQMAVDYGSYNIRVNAILVGLILHEGSAAAVSDPAILQAHRNRHLTRLGEANDVANAAIYLASEESEFVTGTHLTVDGGVSIKSR